MRFGNWQLSSGVSDEDPSVTEQKIVLEQKEESEQTREC